ncbi:MAG TPA: hypothetical protein VKA97_05270, partial [Pyrinomonadaceae bacterium]|nr:hypothetical protein [Pyrinomonadaceae bacterium]
MAAVMTTSFRERLARNMRTVFLAQRRKGAKRYRVSKGFLCAFAPLREKSFSQRGPPDDLKNYLRAKLDVS